MTLNLDNLPEETKKKIQELTALGQNLEFLTQQKIQIDTSLRETELAIDELTKVTPETTVYKNIGGILVKADRNKLLDEKKSYKTTLEMRSKTLEQKTERTRKSFETLQKSLQTDLQYK
ncbi:MAG: prefoldin subunit beta [Promethearchaeota archaeon]|jgi:prefoldin beta subunit